MGYFDDLVPDYTVEVPPASAASLESMRRLLYMFKLAINGVSVLLADDDGNVIGISPEFETQFGWTLAEFQALEPEDFFHADSLDVALIHREHNLAAPYQARCYNKASQSGWFQIQGVCVEFEANHWRMLSFELI